MQVSIEDIDDRFLVRCVVPRNPSFKGAAIADDIDQAFKAARVMFEQGKAVSGGTSGDLRG